MPVTASFVDALDEAIGRKRSVACVGLDPRSARLPPALAPPPDADREAVARAVAAFCARILDAVADRVCAVKPNIAFFEALGPAGLDVYADLVDQAHAAGLLVIGDVKRADIGSTARAYAAAHLGGEGPGTLAAHDAVTVNPYLGTDAVGPFLDACRARGAGLFVLVKTSNPSSAEVQDLALAQRGTVAERVAGLVHGWGRDLCGACGLSSVGAVVGATHAGALARFRALMPRAVLLLPGYGAQGARGAQVTDAFLPGGRGAIVNASRSVLYAWEQDPDADVAQAARKAVDAMNADLGSALAAAGKPLA